MATIGEAYDAGWRIRARCAYGRADTTHGKSSRECTYRVKLDMETLVWTRGRDFPLSRLESRLRCPRCGSRAVRVLFEPPIDEREKVMGTASSMTFL
jgi:hypothetical protein